MRHFEGTVRVRIHPTKGLTLDKGVSGSTLTAADAGEILAKSLEAAAAHKVGFDRWSFYIPGVNEKLPKEQATIPLATVLKHAKGIEPRIRLGKFAKPVMVIADEPAPTTRKSAIIDIA